MQTGPEKSGRQPNRQQLKHAILTENNLKNDPSDAYLINHNRHYTVFIGRRMTCKVPQTVWKRTRSGPSRRRRRDFILHRPQEV